MVSTACARSVKLGVTLAALAVLAACQAQGAASPVVGLSFSGYVDSQRPDWVASGGRPLMTTLWYPAAPGSEQREWELAIFRGGMTAQNAPMATSPKKFPLILLSHGTGGSAITMSWLAQGLAAKGYVVAAVNHHGNTGAEPKYLPQGFALWWERARDLSVLLDKLSADPELGPRIDFSRVGVAGFSLGGYTALSVVGTRIDRARWTSFCASNRNDPSCSLPSEANFSMEEMLRVVNGDERARSSLTHSGDSYLDKRIRAAFVIAPVLASAMVPESLAKIGVPVAIVVGENDEQAPPRLNAEPIAKGIPGAKLERVPKGTHYMFLASCKPLGKIVAREICSDPNGVDRDKIQRQTADAAARFFNTALTATPR